MNPWAAQPPALHDSYVGHPSIDAQAQRLYDSFSPQQLALLLAVNGTARAAQVHQQDQLFPQESTPQHNSPASSYAAPDLSHVQPASRAVTPSPQGRKRSRGLAAGSSTKKRKPSIDIVVADLPSLPEGKAKRPLNSWIAFRCYYCKIFSSSQQKDISGFLRQLWQSDPFKTKWGLLASAWSLIRDEVGKKKAPLDSFIELVVPFLEICPSEHYLEVLGWEIVVDDDTGLASFRRSRDFKLDQVGESTNTPYSIIDVVKYAVANSYVPEGSINLNYPDGILAQDTRKFTTGHEITPNTSQDPFVDNSDTLLAQAIQNHLGVSVFPFPQQQVIQSIEPEPLADLDAIEEHSDLASAPDPALGVMDITCAGNATYYGAPPQVLETVLIASATSCQSSLSRPFTPRAINTTLANTILPWLKGWMKDYARGLSGPLTPKTVTNKLAPFLLTDNEVQSVSPPGEVSGILNEPVANTDQTGTSFPSAATFNGLNPAITVSSPVSTGVDPALTVSSTSDPSTFSHSTNTTRLPPSAGTITRPASALLTPINTSRAAAFGKPWSPMPLSASLTALLNTPNNPFLPSMFSPASGYTIFGLGETSGLSLQDSAGLGGGFVEGEIREKVELVSGHEAEKDTEMEGLEDKNDLQTVDVEEKILDDDDFGKLGEDDGLFSSDMEGK